MCSYRRYASCLLYFYLHIYFVACISSFRQRCRLTRRLFKTRGRRDLIQLTCLTVHFIMLFVLFLSIWVSPLCSVFSIKSTWKGSEFRFIIYGIFSCFFFLARSLPLPKKFLVTRYLNIINALFSFCVFYIDFFPHLQSPIAKTFLQK